MLKFDFKMSEDFPIELYPVYKTMGSAAFDLHYAGKDSIVLQPFQVYKIPTGMFITEMDSGLALHLKLRSSFGSKGIVITSSALVDSDYKQEISVPILSLVHGIKIQPYERLFQGELVCIYRPENMISTTTRTGGFGSTK